MSKRYVVTLNTYPCHLGVKRAEVGDVVRWDALNNYNFGLVGEVDGATVYTRTASFESGECTVFSGVIARVNRHGYVLKIEEIKEKK